MTDWQSCNTSIIIITYESERDIELCLRSIVAYTVIPYQLCIFDNASCDGTRDIVNSLICGNLFADNLCEEIIFFKSPNNIGYAPAINKAIDLCPDAEHFVFLNPDTIVCEGWLQRLLQRFNKKTGIVGPISNAVAGFQRADFWLNKIQPSILYGPGVKLKYLTQQIAEQFGGQTAKVKFISGFCLMTSRLVLSKVGALDDNFFLGIDDLEFCVRVQAAGYDLCVACDVFVYHRGSSSISSFPRKEYQRLHKQMGAHFCALLHERYGDTIPSSNELFGFEFFDLHEFDPQTPYPSMQWQQRLVCLDGETLELIQELA